VIVECDQCHAQFHYDEERFDGKAAKKLRCSKCRAIFEVVNTRAFEAQPTVRPRLPPDETATRHSGQGAARPLRREAPAASRPPAAELKLPQDVKLSLAVIAGPDAGRMFLIEKPRTVIGREGVDLALDDPEISRQHAAIEVAGERVTVVDLGSANGTRVGDESVAEAPLENQGEFTVGGSTLMLIVTAL
jgi:predicted Zn finger-like uncharacterized protein